MALKIWHIGAVILCMSPAPSHAEFGGDREYDENLGYDQENAEDINELCAGCHGANGQGGKGGIYPRLAGLDPAYMAKQIEDFKSRKRINLPMLPYANDRELAPEDVHDITNYLAGIQLGSKLPEQTGHMDGLERLRQAESIVQIGRHAGDVNRGERLYNEACKVCHSRDGMGRADKPQLIGQHIEYLNKQLRDFREGKREHIDWEIKFSELSDNDMNSILAYLSILDD